MTRYSFISIEELIRICAQSNEADAWEEFVSRFDRAITLSVVRTTRQWMGVSGHLVDDLVQETYVKLFADKLRMLSDFVAQHPESVLGYVKIIAINVVHDYFKSAYSQKRGRGKVQESLETVDPKAAGESLGSPGGMERQILLRQIDECISTSSSGADQERDRLIFWFHYQQGMSAAAIAALPTMGLTAKGVESAILRLTRLVRHRMVQIRSELPVGQKPIQKGVRRAESY